MTLQQAKALYEAAKADYERVYKNYVEYIEYTDDSSVYWRVKEMEHAAVMKMQEAQLIYEHIAEQIITESTRDLEELKKLANIFLSLDENISVEDYIAMSYADLNDAIAMLAFAEALEERAQARVLATGSVGAFEAYLAAKKLRESAEDELDGVSSSALRGGITH